MISAMRAVIALLTVAFAAATSIETGLVDAYSAEATGLPSSQPPIAKVFLVCIFFYGIVGTLWFLFSRLPKETANYNMYRIGVNCITYTACGITMHMLNKSLATTLKEPSLISAGQMVVAVAFFMTIAYKDLIAADRKTLLTWCIVPILFAAMLISSFYTYEYISLSMLTIMRNLTPLVVLPTEMLFMPPDQKPQSNIKMILAMVCMLIGAALYGGALEVSAIGVMFAVVNMILAVSDRLIQRFLLVNHCKSLPSSVCSILNNGIALFPTMIMAGFTNELVGATGEMASNWTDPVVLIVLLISGFVGMGVGYFGMEAQRDISATSIFVLQNAAKLGVVFLGITVFGDPIKSMIANMGLLMSLAGSFAYGHSQMMLKEETAEKQKLMKQEDEKA